MYTLFWLSAFTALVVLHFVVMPRIVAIVVASPTGTAVAGTAHERRCFVIWSGVVALFTVFFFAVSVAVWGRAGYLGTLFFVCALFLWMFRWLAGDSQNREASEVFDNGLSATLAGCVVGTVVGWVVLRFLG